MSSERITLDMARIGDRDLGLLAWLSAWEASDIDCPEGARPVMFSLADQCREVLDWRRIALGAMEQDLEQ